MQKVSRQTKARDVKTKVQTPEPSSRVQFEYHHSKFTLTNDFEDQLCSLGVAGWDVFALNFTPGMVGTIVHVVAKRVKK